MKNLLFLKPGGGRTIYTGPALAFDLFFLSFIASSKTYNGKMSILLYSYC